MRRRLSKNELDSLLFQQEEKAEKNKKKLPDIKPTHDTTKMQPGQDKPSQTRPDQTMQVYI